MRYENTNPSRRVGPGAGAAAFAAPGTLFVVEPLLSYGITLKEESLALRGNVAGDHFTLTEDAALSFTACFGEGWSYNAGCSNFFPSDAANARVTDNGDGTVTFAYTAPKGTAVALSDLRNVILNATAAQLPTLKITMDGDFSAVTKEDYVDAEFELTLGTRQFASGSYSGTGEIKGRDNTSWTYPQKPYSIKLSEKASWLDIPKTKKYAIISCYADGSVLRNYMTYHTAQALMGIDYNPRCEFVAVYLNGVYNGIYLLCERVDIESNKIDIEEATEDNINGGYLIEKDAGDKVDKDADFWFPVPFQANPNEDLFTVKAGRRTSPPLPTGKP